MSMARFLLIILVHAPMPAQMPRPRFAHRPPATGALVVDADITLGNLETNIMRSPERTPTGTANSPMARTYVLTATASGSRPSWQRISSRTGQGRRINVASRWRWLMPGNGSAAAAVIATDNAKIQTRSPTSV